MDSKCEDKTFWTLGQQTVPGCSLLTISSNKQLSLENQTRKEIGKQICPLPWDICVRFNNSAALDNSRKMRGRVTHEQPVWGHTRNQSSVLGRACRVLIAGSCAVGYDAPITGCYTTPLQCRRDGADNIQTQAWGCTRILIPRSVIAQTIMVSYSVT
jgi:hypothetical protein